MIYYHKLEDRTIDLDYAILHHSADETAAYKTVFGEPIYIGYYFPKEYVQNKKYPLFIFIHGGGWSSNKIFDDQSHWQGDYLGFLARYYTEKGYVCVSIDYRKARESGQAQDYGLIDCYEDCCDAMDYILNYVDKYRINRDKIYLLGESAGGHLAGALETFHYDRRYTFKKVFLVNAITHLYDQWQSIVPVKSNHQRLSGLSFKDRVEFLSPLCQIDENTSETVLIHGERDSVVLPDHSIRFHEKMSKYKKKCELHLIADTNHAFLLAEYTNQGLTACRIAIDIINKEIE